MKYVTIEVTQEDINKGEREGGFHCPIARAAHRAGFPDAYVAEREWCPIDLGPAVPLSKRARDFVAAFDAGRPVHPDRFRLRVE